MENLDSLKIASKLLKSQREKLNLSIDEVSLELRLEKKIIENIENGNFDNSKNYLFLKGYLKNYADFLGVKINLPDNKRQKKFKVKKVNNQRNKNNISRYLVASVFLIITFIFLTGDFSNQTVAENQTINDDSYDHKELEDNLKTTIDEVELDNIVTPYNKTDDLIYNELDSDIEVIDNSKKNIEIINNFVDEENILKIDKSKSLVMNFSGDSWIEIIDSKNNIVFFDLVKSGKTLELNILAPFEILLGDATVVNIKYNNKVIKVPYFNPDNNVGKIKVDN